MRRAARVVAWGGLLGSFLGSFLGGVLGGVLGGGLGCGKAASPPPPVVAPVVEVALWCDQVARTLVVTGDVPLDATLCGGPWHSLQVEAGPRTELLRAVPGRAIWLRRTLDHAFVEVRTGARVTATLDRVTEISSLARAPTKAAHDRLAITHAGTTVETSIAELEQRYGGDGRLAELSLCRLAEDHVGHPPTTITVHGDGAAPLVFTGAECVARGLVLKFSGRGEIRLRGAIDGTRILRVVRAVVL